jgi:general secretion pathway protein H
MAGAAQVFDFGCHRPICDETDHLAQQIRVRALLQKAREAGCLSTDILGLSAGGGAGPPTRVCGRSTMTASRVRRVSPNSLSVARRVGLSAFGIPMNAFGIPMNRAAKTMTAYRVKMAAECFKLWIINWLAIEHVAPLCITCALLLRAMLLIADSSAALVHLPDWRSHSWLKSELERDLAVVQANMVEFPPEAEAAAVGQLASKVQMVSLETRQVAAALRALLANYTEFERGRKTEFVELERSIHQIQDEVRWLQKQQEELKSQTKSAMAEGRLVKSLSYPAQHVAEPTGDVAAATAAHYVSYPENFADLLSENDETALSYVTMTAMRIASSLRDTRQEALLSGQERSFTLDVDKRLFKRTAASQPMLLDSDLDLSVYIAKSELIDDTIGGIRFFPDGSSTGGRIDLALHGERATLVVDWSTGAVDIEKAAGEPHLVQARATGHTPSRMK